MKKLNTVQRAYVASLFATIQFVFVVIVILQLNKGQVVEVNGTFKKGENTVFSFELESYEADDLEVNEQLVLRDKDLNVVYEAVVMRIIKIQYENSSSKMVCDLRILDDESIENGEHKSMELIRSSGDILNMLFN